MSDYHEPVLLKESIEALVSDPDGVYIDVTYGGGGHSAKILDQLSAKGRLIVFDQDEDARLNLIKDERLVFVPSNFRFLYRFWKWLDLPLVNGILADLGVSSHQINEASRGFSFRFDADLDMKMNQSAKITARNILNSYDLSALQNMFSQYGEIRNAKKLAGSIIKERENAGGIKSSYQFNQLLHQVIVGDRTKYLAKVYQSLRIEVNDEMGALEDMLLDTIKVSADGAKLVVISYHSLEDRLVKRFMKSGNLEGKIETDLYGKKLRKIKPLSKLILPSDAEVERNNRARSAKMRVGEFIK